LNNILPYDILYRRRTIAMIYLFQGDKILRPRDSLPGQYGFSPSLCPIPAGDLADRALIPSLDNGPPIEAWALSAGAGFPPPLEAALLRLTLGLDPLAVSCESGDRAAFQGGAGELGRALRALHILRWRAESRFCGSCGAENGDSTVELARVCPACGRIEYPRIAPAIITLIVNRASGRALLAHNAKFSPAVYSLIAGFVEAGENLEAAVRREAREEVSLEIKNIRYITSQPWPFPNSLMNAFSADYAAGEIRPDGIEITDARWYSRDELPKLPGNGSVGRYLIHLWEEGQI
jgi:NAD+ diphosphatase